VSTLYGQAGVDIAAGQKAGESIAEAVRSTYTPEVVAGLGSFGGVISLDGLRGLEDPLLVATTDGIGTKVMLAAQLERVDGLGADIVHHCANDLLVQGARPFFFLDYFASDRLDRELFRRVVSGMAAACRGLGCAMLGGETAEMPGVYAPQRFDVAGTMVGVVERARLLPRRDLAEGDRLIAIASSGPHTNGYSLIRKLFDRAQLDELDAELGSTLGEALMQPHRCYVELLQPVLPHVKALAHITGGGLAENLPRVLTAGLEARLLRGSWPIPPLFARIAAAGLPLEGDGKGRPDNSPVAAEEMERVFNLGVGMVAVVAPSHLERAQELLGEPSWVIGELAPGPRGVVWHNASGEL